MKRREFIKRSAITVISTGPFLDTILGANNLPVKIYTLESKGLILQITPDGLLWNITNRYSGHRYLATTGESIWKLVISSHKENVLSVFSADRAAEVSVHGDGLEITHDAVRLRKETVPIKVRTVVLPKGDNELEWTFHIENKSSYVISEVWCPLIGKIDSLSGDPRKDALIWPLTTGRRIPYPRAAFDAPGPSGTAGVENRSFFSVAPDWLGYSGETRRYRQVYPGHASMQWYGLYTETEGLYMGSHDKTLQTTTLNLMNSDEGLTLSFIKYPFLDPGEAWSSEPFIVAVDGGDWHLGSKRYRRWVDTWMEFSEPPRWLRDMDGWLQSWIQTPGGRINWTYRGLLELWEATKAAGLNVMKINGWWVGGGDRAIPITLPDPDLGGEQEFKNSLAQIKSEGGKAFLYLNGMTMDADTAFTREKGRAWAMKTREGHPYVQTYNYFFVDGSMDDPMVSGDKIFYACCQSIPGWREMMIASAKQVMNLGGKGITYDQVGGMDSWLCFDRSHPHAKPSLANGRPRLDTFRAVREEVKAIDPDVAMETEFACDAISQVFDICVPPNIGMAYGTLSFTELYRYTFPEKILIKSHIDTDKLYSLHYAFVFGMKFGPIPGQGAGTLADYPRLTQRIRYLVGLRNEYPELLRNGRFIDNEWGSVDNPNILAKGFQSGERIAVIIWNHTFQDQRYSLTLPDHKVERIIPGDSLSLSASIPSNDLCVVIAKA